MRKIKDVKKKIAIEKLSESVRERQRERAAGPAAEIEAGDNGNI